MSNAVNIGHSAAEPTDAWHDHRGEAPPQEQHGEVSPFVIALLGVVSTVVLVAMILILVFYFDQVLLDQRVVKQEQWDVRGEARAVEAQWRQELTGYRWADPQAGTVALPIADAVRSVSTEYATR
jgi:hypothetical protein